MTFFSFALDVIDCVSERESLSVRMGFFCCKKKGRREPPYRV